MQGQKDGRWDLGERREGELGSEAFGFCSHLDRGEKTQRTAWCGVHGPLWDTVWRQSDVYPNSQSPTSSATEMATCHAQELLCQLPFQRVAAIKKSSESWVGKGYLGKAP